MNWAAVLLAAGAGSRMGHRPKSLLQLDGEPLIHRHVQSLHQAGAASVQVVLGHYASDIAAALQGLLVHTVHNPHPDDGLVSSQRLGLQAVPEDCEAVLMMLADQPLLDERDVSALVSQFAQRPAGTDMVFPMVAGVPGNPVMLSAAARQTILARGPDFGCKEWRQAHKAKVLAWACDNLHYTTDLDHLEDLALFIQETGRTLRWPAAWAPA
jgi:CTP:molybdopterin cytidylyltransferase MocA